jgi:hypothetical protein
MKDVLREDLFFPPILSAACEPRPEQEEREISLSTYSVDSNIVCIRPFLLPIGKSMTSIDLRFIAIGVDC